MTGIPYVALFLLLFAFPAFAGTHESAQDSTAGGKVWKVILKDGSEFTGRVERETKDSLAFRTLGGISLLLARSTIGSIQPLRGEIVEGEYRRADPNRTRLFFAPTARSLSAGEGYFSAYEIFFPFAAVGVADFLTLGGGISLFPGADSQLLYLAPKIAIPLDSESAGVAVGVLYFAGLGSAASDFNPGGILYGIGTFGSKFSAVTVGLGYGFAEGELANDPVLMIGGELQLSNSVKILSENWIPIGEDVSLLSFGIRFFGENLAADLGFVYPAGVDDTEGWPFIPWLGFTYNFGGE